MPSVTLQHRRTHNLLLIAKLLNQREATSPFTLITDSVEQSGKPLLREYVKRATVSLALSLDYDNPDVIKASKVETIFVSFETLQKPSNVEVFVPAWKEPFAIVQSAIASNLNNKSGSQRRPKRSRY